MRLAGVIRRDGKRPKAWKNFMEPTEPRGIGGSPWIEHVSPLGTLDGVAICVHLQEVLALVVAVGLFIDIVGVVQTGCGAWPFARQSSSTNATHEG